MLLGASEFRGTDQADEDAAGSHGGSVELNLEVTVRRKGLNCCQDKRGGIANSWPGGCFEDDNSDFSVSEVLLILQVLICGNDQIKSFPLGCRNEVSIC